MSRASFQPDATPAAIRLAPGTAPARVACAAHGQTPLFSSPWWLDAAAPNRWRDVVVERDGRLLARLAYMERSYPLLGRVVSQPPLTPYLGPEFYAADRSGVRQLGEQHELMAELIRQLPRHARFQQNFAPEVTNWLPFYWHGCLQQTRYTYRLTDLSNVSAVWAGFSSSARGAIRKAEAEVELDPHPTSDQLYRLLEATYAAQGMRPGYSREFLGRVFEAARQRGQGQLLIARGPDGRPHAGLLLVWDATTAYYLVGGSDPKLRTSGAASLLIWRAIQHAATVARQFDFEGSMQPQLERFFRGFGAVQTPYFRITRNSLRALAVERAVRGVRSVQRALRGRGAV